MEQVPRDRYAHFRLACDLVGKKKGIISLEQDLQCAIYLYPVNDGTVQVGLQHYLRYQSLALGAAPRTSFVHCRGGEIKFFSMLEKSWRDNLPQDEASRARIDVIRRGTDACLICNVPVSYATAETEEYTTMLERSFSAAILGAYLCDTVCTANQQGIYIDPASCGYIMGVARRQAEMAEFFAPSEVGYLPSRLEQESSSARH